MGPQPDDRTRREVELFSGEISPGTTSHQAVSIDADGALVLAASDLGSAPTEWFGDSDYEYWVRVAAGDKEAVLAKLREEMGEGPTQANVDDRLLELMERRYSGNHAASFDFQRWLQSHGIPYEFAWA